MLDISVVLKINNNTIKINKMKTIKTIKTNNKTIKFYEFSKPNSELVKMNGISCYMKITNH